MMTAAAQDARCLPGTGGRVFGGLIAEYERAAWKRS
jgi:hypothetical protein